MTLIPGFPLFPADYCMAIQTYNEQPVEQLTFEKTTPIKRWHNQEAKFVYLTFDDGPSNNASKIMDLLDQYNVKGTFFVLEPL